MKRTALLLVIAMAAAGGVLAGAPFADSPPLAHTGGFGEPTCAECHAGGSATTPRARVGIAGLPGAYEPGATYALTIRVQHPSMTHAGFQLSARVLAGARKGEQAGTLETTDSRVGIGLAADSVAYAQHLGAQRAETSGTAEWQVTWTAPADDCGAVVFHVAVNAADGDDSPFGDDILLLEQRVDVRN